MAAVLTPEAEESRRALVVAQALAGTLSNAEAARQLSLSVRQVRRLKTVLACKGPSGLVHGNRGRPSPRRVSDAVRRRVIELASSAYAGQNHTRLRQLLAEREGIVVTRATLRRVLLEGGISSPYRRRVPRLPAGTLPIALDLAQRRVTLLDLQGADFREASFQRTLERWRRERPLALRFEVDLDLFAAAARLEPGRPPDGFLFSIGPYDATLLANILSVPDEHLVVKESPVVNALLSGLLNAADEARRREREALVALTLPFMFRPTRGTERCLFFKLSSWNVRLAETLLRLFPDTRAVFVYRPIDVSVGMMLARPPGWQDLLGRPRAVQARFFPTLASVPGQDQLSAAAFYAHTWRSGVEYALALPGDRVLLVAHGDLVAEPRASLTRILEHLRQPASPETLAALTALANSSRDAVARPPLDPRQETEIMAVARDIPQRLRPAVEGGETTIARVTDDS